MASHQPFQCPICHSRFTRNENLKRHTALHSRSREATSLPCGTCKATFSRSDLRLRHLKRKHPEQHEESAPKRSSYEEDLAAESWNHTGRTLRARTASTSPTNSQESFDDRQPTGEGTYESHFEPEDVHLEQSLLFQPDTRPFDDTSTPIPPSVSCATNPTISNHHILSQQSPNNSLTPTTLAYLREDWFPSDAQIARGVHLYFTRVSPFVPFLHQPTFDATSSPHTLLLGMLCLAYQHGENDDDETHLGVKLSVRCFHRARALLAVGEDGGGDAWTHDISVMQSYLLLQICAMMYLCGTDSAYGLQMHSKLIFLARSSGLMQSLLPHDANAAEAPGDLESMWQEFIRAESRKRTRFVLHHIDALWYQVLSIPRSLSHLEIKHDLPCPEDCWAAASAAQWAHRQLLVRRHATPPVPYAQAVRRFLSLDPDVTSLEAFDPYGAINIAQFLISSAREITGWSTMTGQLSIERFEPLRSSLDALRAFICPMITTSSKKTTNAILCEATWETAMIELQMWSPSHTGGIVAGSIDTVLQQSTYQTPSCEFLVETNTARAIQPHVDWFLHYLDAAQGFELASEPPWVTLYAYKAFMIAWRLVCGAMPGAMEAVGVRDGDVDAALAWARGIFQRRRRRKLGELILGCLDALEAQL